MKNRILIIVMLAGIPGMTYAADLLTTTGGRPQLLEIIASTTDPAKTYMWIKLNKMNFVAEYGSERSKAWFQLAKSAIELGRNITIRYDRDFKITYTWCQDYNASGNCTTPGMVATDLAILSVQY